MKVTGIVFAVILILYVAFSILGAVLIMDIPRLPVKGSPSSVDLIYESVSFPSRDDGIALKGWYLPAKGKVVIILVHGGFQNRIDDNADTLGLARDLVKRGYNILLFDQRGRGESAGAARSLLHFQQDIGGAVDFARGMGFFPDQIGVLGFCSGAISTCILRVKNMMLAQ